MSKETLEIDGKKFVKRYYILVSISEDEYQAECQSDDVWMTEIGKRIDKAVPDRDAYVEEHYELEENEA